MAEPGNQGDRFNGFIKTDQIVTEENSNPYQQFNRTSFERDRDRVLYDRYFRRLNDVTQVARAGESYLYHDRQTHSLKVAQVGRRLAELLIRRREQNSNQHSLPRIVLDPDVVEAACLAHDMGHPPFGHLAEQELDDLLIEKTHPDGEKSEFDPDEDDATAVQKGDTPGGIRYEGNAQTFRIITRLAAHNDPETGLGLTKATLNAVLKYPYGRGEWIREETRSEGKFGYYKTEQEAFDFATEGLSNEHAPVLAAEIMDYADDVTYAIHDMTDFYITGQIPLDRLLREARQKSDAEDDKNRNSDDIETTELDSFQEYLDNSKRVELSQTSAQKLFARLAESALGYPTLFETFSGSQRERNLLDGFRSYLIGFYLDADNEKISEDNKIRLAESKNKGGSETHYHVKIDREIEEEISILRELTHYYVIQDSSLMAQQRGQRKIIRTLFETLYEEAQGDEMSLSAIPKPYSEWVAGDLCRGSFGPPSNGRARAVADFISSMTEQQAIEMYERLTGHSPGSLENRIIR
ncbi:dNTP triphosphohydrolase [Natronomonas sp. F2-12]|uniref:DNTP triphosphohydrolase n=1 Tax=Natronomonas aquatica TaxID=2841590 RepID=A0A9R1CTG1_9EURY|nr:dNTP triphosphohydrolase [Natronomonas aquatica]MCQ4334909.1 dNTP triphosphohydrolase [Natronomonas aquatica]